MAIHLLYNINQKRIPGKTRGPGFIQEARVGPRFFFIAYIKKRPTALFSIIGRGAAGLSFIYFFNFFCAARDIITGIGINPITGAVCTVLGIPGAILLYAIKIYSFL